MPRKQPRRTSHASTGSYTSYFSTGGDSNESSPPSSQDSSSSSSHNPSPPPTTTRNEPPQASTSAVTLEDQPNTMNEEEKEEEIAKIEQDLEALFRSTAGPVHSLRTVKKKDREDLEARMKKVEFAVGLRKWWTTRQWSDKRKAATSATVQPKPPSPPPREESKEPAKPIEVERSFETTKSSLSSSKSKVKPRPTVKKPKEPEEQKIEPVVAEETKDVKRSLAESTELPRVKDEAYSPLIFSPTLARTPLFVPPRHPSPSIKFVDPKAILKSSDNHDEPSLDTSSLLVHVDDLQSLLAKEEEKEVELEPAPVLSARIEEKEQMIELPALALGIGTWSRRAEVDPSQLRVVYSLKTDALIFSTQHLESVYHLHLPVASITALILFHSLAQSRSHLLILRDRSASTTATATDTASSSPRFALTSSNANSSYSVTPIQDFTPDQQASKNLIYSLELNGTSLLPSLLEEIDSLSSTLKLKEGKLFVGPWNEVGSSSLTLEDLMLNCLIVQKKIRKNGKQSKTTTENYTFKYNGEEQSKKGKELWARRWTF